MNAIDTRHTVTSDESQSNSLVAAMGIMKTANHAEPGEENTASPRPSFVPFLFDFIGSDPISFAFSAGQEATFRVPAGQRFVVEHLNISCWAQDEQFDVHLVTNSSCTYCNLMPTRAPKQVLPGEHAETATLAPTLVQGSTAHTFLFARGDEQCSCTVPAETYLQVWGHLEPTSDFVSFDMKFERAQVHPAA